MMPPPTMTVRAWVGNSCAMSVPPFEGWPRHYHGKTKYQLIISQNITSSCNDEFRPPMRKRLGKREFGVGVDDYPSGTFEIRNPERRQLAEFAAVEHEIGLAGEANHPAPLFGPGAGEI